MIKYSDNDDNDNDENYGDDKKKLIEGDDDGEDNVDTHRHTDNDNDAVRVKETLLINWTTNYPNQLTVCTFESHTAGDSGTLNP